MEKKAKEKKEKKVIVPFEKIDITSATEDEIIQSGLRHHVQQDIICYCIMGLIVLLAALPPILRSVNPIPITEVDKDIVYVTLKCAYPSTVEDYTFYTNIENNYRDGQLTNLNLQYTYKKNTKIVETDANGEPVQKEEEIDENDIPTFSALEKMKSADIPGLTQKKVENGYEFNADFTKSKFRNEAGEVYEELKDYAMVAGAEQDYLKSIGFYCSTESETKRERVYVDTNEKVE